MLHIIRRIHSINGRNSIVNQLLLTKNVRTASSVPTKKVETKTSPEETKTEDLDEKFLKVFHYPHVIKVALYQRLKVYLTGSTFILTPIVYSTGGQTLLGGYPTFLGLLGFSSLALLISGEWMRRVIGIIYIDKTDLKTVRFSHISFWGKRKELLINIDDIKFLSDTSQKETANHNVFWKVQFYDPKLSTMFISTKYGGITDPDKFRLIFGSSALQPIQK